MVATPRHRPARLDPHGALDRIEQRLDELSDRLIRVESLLSFLRGLMVIATPLAAVIVAIIALATR